LHGSACCCPTGRFGASVIASVTSAARDETVTIINKASQSALSNVISGFTLSVGP